MSWVVVNQRARRANRLKNSEKCDVGKKLHLVEVDIASVAAAAAATAQKVLDEVSDMRW